MRYVRWQQANTLIAMIILKKIDAVLGPMIVPAVAKLFRPRKMSTHVSAILIIRPGGIGDAVLLIPAIRGLMAKYPYARIDILAEKRNANIFALCPGINNILLYDRRENLCKVIRGQYDITIDSEQWHRLSAVVARLTRSSVSVGYDTNERKMLFTHQVPYSHDEYEVESFFRLLSPIVKEDVEYRKFPFLNVPPEHAAKAERLLASLSPRSVIVLFPGGSIVERKWGDGRFHQMAMLLHDKGYGIVVVGGNDDVQAGEEIVSDLPGALNLCGKLSLPETAAVLKESVLLVTGDSGIMHIGYGLGIKVLALFGPGREKKWAPRGRNCKAINKQLPCSPCTTFGYTPKCRKNAPCMSSITVDEVFREALALIEA